MTWDLSRFEDREIHEDDTIVIVDKFGNERPFEPEELLAA